MLVIPSIVGILLFAYQLLKFIETGNLAKSIDTEYNSIFGLFLCIWGSVFVENWHSKEKKLKQMWDLKDSQSILVNDERKGYLFHWAYN
jgi:hypothetical protein